MPRLVIVGAGPAGLAAAGVLVAHGVAPILVDEGRRPGGQAYRRPSEALDLDMDALLGSEARKFRRLHGAFEAIQDRLDYRPETLAWNVSGNELFTIRASRIEALPYDALLLASGAIDRVLPIKGWTLPGVFTLGAAQVLLKDQGCLIGRRIVFCGSSPLLYLAALQYRMMGAEIAAVLDTTHFSRKIAALPKLSANPRTFARGLGYLRNLIRSGVPVRHGVRLLEFGGKDSVERLVYLDSRGITRTVACDAVAFGFGLVPQFQLAELAECELRYDAVFRQWLPKCDVDGRSRKGVYIAGDGGAIGGADAAEASGVLAACALLEDHGIEVAGVDKSALRRQLGWLRRFQVGLATAFAWPSAWPGELADEIPVCRCESITAGDLRRALQADFGAAEINRLKAFTRVGMGRCQGRYCGLAAAELAAAALGLPHEQIGRLRAQAPVKPLPMSGRMAE
jgi:NADPH-dependent 2,4-dienoyl-CoA reductase/sulfur reductase-like enzyme